MAPAVAHQLAQREYRTSSDKRAPEIPKAAASTMPAVNGGGAGNNKYFDRSVARWSGVKELRSPAVGAAVLPLPIPATIHAASASLSELDCFDQNVPQLELAPSMDGVIKLLRLSQWLGLLLPGKNNAKVRSAIAEDALKCCCIYEEAYAQCDDTAGGAGHYHVSMELVDRPGCTRFHLDYLRVRLLRVYWGPTTEIVTDGASGVNWEAFQALEKNEKTVPNLDHVQRVPAESALVLKGRRFHPDIKRTGGVHRSPGTRAPGWLYNYRGQPRRLLLKVDDAGCSK
eukprot:jgi/Tetstr1/421371/TSEL_012340.t1